MPNFLTIDASTEVCSVAVALNGKVFEESCAEPRSHAKVLLPLVDQLLTSAGISLAAMDAIGVSRGPGSFTGIRIGLGVAQGLAYGAGKPLIGIDSLTVLAHSYLYRCTSEIPDNALLLAALDARMKEVYWAGYKAIGGALVKTLPGCVTAPSDLVESMRSSEALHIIGVGHGWKVAASDGLNLCEPELKPSAAAMIGLVADEFVKLQAHAADSTPLQNATIEPVYLRNEITWEKRKRVRNP